MRRDELFPLPFFRDFLFARKIGFVVSPSPLRVSIWYWYGFSRTNETVYYCNLIDKVVQVAPKEDRRNGQQAK